MTSPFLEQQKHQRDGTPEISPPPQSFAKPWWLRNLWKIILVPIVFQIVVGLGLSSFFSSKIKTQNVASLQGFFANVPEDFPKALLPSDFDVKQVVQVNEQTTVMGEVNSSIADIFTQVREQAHAGNWLVSTQMPSPQGAIMVLTKNEQRLEIVMNTEFADKTQVLYTLHSQKN